MELNPLHLLLLTAAMSGSHAADRDIFTDDRYHIVRTKVLENNLTPDGLSGQAILRIDEVLEGEPILLERTVKVINSDKPILGSMISPVIYPLMKKDEEWLLVVGSEKDTNELWLGQAMVPGVAHLPLLKGRDSSYEPVQKMLRNRRDHPEKHSVTEPASAKAPSEWDRNALLVVGKVEGSVELERVPGGFSAKLLVIEVLQGRQDLIGKSFTAFTSDLGLRGIREIYIRPKLQPGDIGVFHIEGGGVKYRQILWGGGAYGDALPVVKGSSFDVDGSKRKYEDVLQRFRDRRDHPEKYAVPVSPSAEAIDAKPSQASPVPDLPAIQPPSGTSTTAGQPSLRLKEPEKTADEDIGSWMSGTIAALVVLVLIWFLRRHSRKGTA